ncbi:mucin-2-like isoform X6 [Dreissena polymorpha]|uniref:mucin-2-like isoform X6 n=1 Tax=Dreissena polymorpha TaxID=45954 RepID=UPI002264975D|nr:mucin-2-like isoform X6 [Dreissena polymorpha]
MNKTTFYLLFYCFIAADLELPNAYEIGDLCQCSAQSAWPSSPPATKANTIDRTQTTDISQKITETTPFSQTSEVPHYAYTTAEDKQTTTKTTTVTHMPPTNTNKPQKTTVTHMPPTNTNAPQKTTVTHVPSTNTYEPKTTTVTHLPSTYTNGPQKTTETHVPSTDTNEPQKTTVTHVPSTDTNESQKTTVTHVPPTNTNEPQKTTVTHVPPTNSYEPQKTTVTHVPLTDINEQQKTTVTHVPSTDINEPQKTTVTHVSPTNTYEPQKTTVTHVLPTNTNESQKTTVTHVPSTDTNEPQKTTATHVPPTNTNEPHKITVTHVPPTNSYEPQKTTVTHVPSTDTNEPQKTTVTHGPPTNTYEPQKTTVTHVPPTDTNESQKTTVTNVPPTNTNEPQKETVTHVPPTNSYESQKTTVTQVPSTYTNEPHKTTVTDVPSTYTNEPQKTTVTHVPSTDTIETQTITVTHAPSTKTNETHKTTFTHVPLTFTNKPHTTTVTNVPLTYFTESHTTTVTVSSPTRTFDKQTASFRNDLLTETETQPTIITNAHTDNNDTTTTTNKINPSTGDKAEQLRKRRQLDKSGSVVFGVWNNKRCQCEPNGVETHRLEELKIAVPLKIRVNATFIKNLENKSTKAYTDYEREFQEKLTVRFLRVDGFVNVVINNFTNGSIVCNSKVITKADANLPKTVMFGDKIDFNVTLNGTNYDADIDDVSFSQDIFSRCNHLHSSPCQDSYILKCTADCVVGCVSPCLQPNAIVCENSGQCMYNSNEKKMMCRCAETNSHVYTGDTCAVAIEKLKLASKYIVAIATSVGVVMVITFVVVVACVVRRYRNKAGLTENDTDETIELADIRSRKAYVEHEYTQWYSPSKPRDPDKYFSNHGYDEIPGNKVVEGRVHRVATDDKGSETYIYQPSRQNSAGLQRSQSWYSSASESDHWRTRETSPYADPNFKFQISRPNVSQEAIRF